MSTFNRPALWIAGLVAGASALAPQAALGNVRNVDQVRVEVPTGWHSRACPPWSKPGAKPAGGGQRTIILATFPLPRRCALLQGNTLPNNRRWVSGDLVQTVRDISTATRSTEGTAPIVTTLAVIAPTPPLEGIPLTHRFARRTVVFSDDVFEVFAEAGSRFPRAKFIAAANAALGGFSAVRQ